MEKTFNTNYGDATVRNVMLDGDGTNLEEGIEIAIRVYDLIEIPGWKDIDELTADDVDQLISNNL